MGTIVKRRALVGSGRLGLFVTSERAGKSDRYYYRPVCYVAPDCVFKADSPAA